MAPLTSALAPAGLTVPPVPGLPLLGNLLQFRRDRLGLQDEAARVGPIARLQLAHIPIYVVTDADIAHEVLVDECRHVPEVGGPPVPRADARRRPADRRGRDPQAPPQAARAGVRAASGSRRTAR